MPERIVTQVASDFQLSFIGFVMPSSITTSQNLNFDTLHPKVCFFQSALHMFPNNYQTSKYHTKKTSRTVIIQIKTTRNVFLGRYQYIYKHDFDYLFFYNFKNYFIYLLIVTVHLIFIFVNYIFHKIIVLYENIFELD